MRLAVSGVAAISVVYGVRTLTRTPFWFDSGTVVLEGLLQHPENFRTRVQLARFLERSGKPAPALAEYLVAGTLFPRDPFVPLLSARLALRIGRPRLAWEELERARQLAPDHPAIHRLRVETFDALRWRDSAFAAARAAIDLAPLSRMAAEAYRELLRRNSAPEWQLELAETRLRWLAVELTSATRGLQEAERLLEGARSLDDLCWELRSLQPAYRTLAPQFESKALAVGAGSGLTCSAGIPPPAGPR